MFSRPKASVCFMVWGLLRFLGKRSLIFSEPGTPLITSSFWRTPILNEASFFPSLRRVFALRFRHGKFCRWLHDAAP